MSALLAPPPATARTTVPSRRRGSGRAAPTGRPRLQLVGPGFVPQPALPAVAPAPARPAPLTLTRRGRRVAATLVLLLAAAAAAALGTWAGLAVREAPAGPVSSVTVEPGQTLWALAAATADPGEDVRDVLAGITDLNQLDSDVLRAGQVLLVPAG
ncbi:LysM peptidoglycan-binding domain-containing protein [Georgenia sp. TF02-10]|uniref:LysM peptidoglycan-binding domain-containing protein n=1 Tax=Georgenia sp. TF02-10 TaxID=2917725 RepID=UPI001FA749FB|nr:LysM peptidoglycan-binding domain-containing protein [Georgenia sp. TF02-10]UNX55959.1 LysM peptidoglycan-binding domain-containing protein [Georgenia sp. TF02-10]